MQEGSVCNIYSTKYLLWIVFSNPFFVHDALIMYDLLILSVLFPVLIIFFVKSARKPDRFPPGPPWLPMIGCLWEMKKLRTKKIHLVGDELKKTYGPIVGLKMGRDKLVMVTEYETIKEVLNSEAFDGRPDGYFFRLRSLGKRLGIVFVDGPFMMDQRKFCLNQLRNSGLGKGVMDEIIFKEAHEIANLIETECEKGPIQVQNLFDVGTLNAIWTLVTGERFSLEDKKLFRLINMVHACFHLIDISGGLLNKMPFLRFIAPSLSGYTMINDSVNEMMDFIRDIVEKHEKCNRADFIGMFLEEIRKSQGNESTSFTKEQLLVLLEDLFMAGMETTSSTLSFAILYLIKYPDIQDEIHKELDTIGSVHENLMSDDYDKLLLLKATIMEVQRHGNPVPVAIPHRAMKDVELKGFKIPMDTFILPSLWSIHMDEKYWLNPKEFNPHRFIEDGKIKEHKCFMPFGSGRRKCIGETLARRNVFLFLCVILHKFRIEPSTPNMSVDILGGFTQVPAPFEVKFIPRTNN